MLTRADLADLKRAFPPDNGPPDDDRRMPSSPEDYGLPTDGETLDTVLDTGAAESAVLITPLDWPDEAPPPVDWLAEGRIPRGDVTTLHGDGGAGKTDIACQLAEGCARRAPYWMGHAITPGPVVIISAEEPQR
jgi:hypothetical protein